MEDYGLEIDVINAITSEEYIMDITYGINSNRMRNDAQYLNKLHDRPCDEANKDVNVNEIVSQLKPCMTHPIPCADFSMNIPACGCAIQKDPGLKIAEKNLGDFGWKMVDAFLKLFSEMSNDDFKKFQENYRR